MRKTGILVIVFAVIIFALGTGYNLYLEKRQFDIADSVNFWDQPECAGFNQTVSKLKSAGLMQEIDFQCPVQRLEISKTGDVLEPVGINKICANGSIMIHVDRIEGTIFFDSWTEDLDTAANLMVSVLHGIGCDIGEVNWNEADEDGKQTCKLADDQWVFFCERVNSKRRNPSIEITAVNRAVVKFKATWFDRMNSVIQNAQTIELISLEPLSNSKSGSKFRGWHVLGSGTIRSPHELKAIRSFVAKNMYLENAYAYCFEPRHAIRAKFGGDSLDLVICFECREIHAWMNGARTAHYVNKQGRPELDELLESHRIEISHSNQ